MSAFAIAAFFSSWSDHLRCSSSSRPCVLPLPHERQPRARRRTRAQQLLQQALCTAPATRTAAAGQAATTQQLLQQALCTAPATRTPDAGQAATTRAAAPPEGCVYCACHTKASRGPGGEHARSSSSRRLCALRLPHESQPRARRRPRAQQLLQKAVCTAPATRTPVTQKSAECCLMNAVR